MGKTVPNGKLKGEARWEKIQKITVKSRGRIRGENQEDRRNMRKPREKTKRYPDLIPERITGKRTVLETDTGG